MGWKVPDSRMAAAAERVVATREEQAYFEAHMARVLQACAGGSGSTSPCNAAHIVEPNTGLVVGEGADCRHSHPLHHAVMAAIAGAAAWDRQQWPTVPSVCAMPEAGSEEHEQGAGFSGGPGAMQQQQQQQHCTNGNPQAAHQASAPTGPEGRPDSCTGHVLRCAADEGVVPKRQRTNDSSDGPCCLPPPYPQQQQPYNFQRTDDSSDRPGCLPPPHPQQQQHSNFQQQTQDGSHEPCCLPPSHPQQQQQPYNFQQRTDDSSDRPCCLPPPHSQQQEPPTTFQQPCTNFQQWTGDSPDRPSCLPPPHPQQQRSTTFQQQPEPAPLQQRSGHVVEQKGDTHHLQQELHQLGCSGQLPQGPQGHNASIAAALGLPRPYMCTGYDCFIAREPCVMCAMALVHSRVARVVFCHPDVDGGALGGRLQLMGQRSLNHHYKVYRLGLAPDAKT
ncbi:hypothetical protein DUNSADRAFT_13611 [Dunaliella salina]|uniref:CMP/dCMP-type deaminase domain-containing protein n=1 Tax=Dunaliella salina TaxID=3046 RepID=A0ABQ7G913_DUNSA|nr:hypothetical protein DUNSADRAFT_13611 [Dunaliella salina]|eukprot:KAF5831104.1 hypothetical protein DUNSADRAFT_13611 [Dunaliella salina]